jgi:hypothetical protein
MPSIRGRFFARREVRRGSDGAYYGGYMPIGPNRYVCTLFFNAYQSGWSETYFIGSDSYQDAATAIEAIATARRAMLVNDVELEAIRVSDTDVKGDSWPVISAFPVPGTYGATPALLSSNLGLALRLKIFGGPLKRAARFVRAIPSDCLGPGAEFNPTAAFNTALTNWMSLVEVSCNIGTRIKNAVSSPFYLFTAITGYETAGLEKRNIGRPFGLTRGRRQIA